ncbi:hypothetical protein DFH06DRAFT_974858, partial [Mycena polygramma]
FFSAPILTEMGTKWLSTHQVLHPTMRISLAIRFHVPQWIEPAFRTLTRTPLRSLTVAQINELGFSPYIILAETQAKIAEHRTFCALTVPPVIHGPYCPHPSSCEKSFAHAWWGESVKHGIAVAMIHPAQMPAKKIISSLPDLITSYHMPAACRKLTLDALLDDPSVMLREEVFIAAAVKELKKF